MQFLEKRMQRLSGKKNMPSIIDKLKCCTTGITNQA